MTIKILEIYRDRFIPKPKAIKMSEKQKVIFNDNKYIPSPYLKKQ